MTLLLALTDQFHDGPVECYSQALAVVPKLDGEYEREYYRGIIAERRGQAVAEHDPPGARAAAYDFVREAMHHFQRAEPLRPAGNDDAILRWNHCVRLYERYQLHPEPDEPTQPILGDDYTGGKS